MRARLGASRAALLLVLPALLVAWTVAAPHADAAPPAARAYRSCATPAEGRMHCMSTWRPTAATTGDARRTARPDSTSPAVPEPPSGLHPHDVRTAYHLPVRGKTSPTIAIVDAYDSPTAEQDLTVYRSAFGLGACTTANGCFRKVDQRGATTYPESDPGWGVEIALDVQAVSASCRSCKILLVEADDDTPEALAVGVDTAVRLGASVVSNSYGTAEFGGMAAYAPHYVHPGVAVLASSGDDGFTSAAFPAVLQTTWAVGGTTLKRSKSGSWSADAWEGAGSGCSAYIAKPAVQKDKHCAMRTVSDVSAVADPENEFVVYDTFGLGDDDGWIAVGGTSLSSPLVAGMIGLAGHPAKVDSPAYLYTHRKGLRDVTGGSNGECGDDYLCSAVKGYDGPTGLGSPWGLASF